MRRRRWARLHAIAKTNSDVNPLEPSCSLSPRRQSIGEALKGRDIHIHYR